MSATGQWAVVIQSPMGAQEATLSLTQNGASLSGTQSSPVFGNAEIESASADGDKLKWTVQVSSPMPMTLEHDVTISGDTMTGSVSAGAFGSFPLTGQRA